MTSPGGHAGTRRLLRFAAPALLAAALMVLALHIGDPAAARPLAVPAAALIGAAALAVTLRYPRPKGPGQSKSGRAAGAGNVLLLAGIAVMLAALAAANAAGQQARIARLCAGQSAEMSGWTVRLAQVQPIAREGYTALQAQLAASREGQAALAMMPELRSPAGSDQSAGAARLRLWQGDLAADIAAFDGSSGCMALDLSWRPFAVWAPGGALLAALGAGLLAMAALWSLNWRMVARERIAMRRSERPLPGAQAPQGRRATSKASLAGLAAGIATLVGVSWPTSPTLPAAEPFTGGAALIAGRQAAIDGPPNTDRWVVIADAMARRGRFSDAAEILQGSVEARPRGMEGWLALGDALYAHAGGRLTPAAELAYDRADGAVLTLSGAPPPSAMAMQRSGRAELAQMWVRRFYARQARAGEDQPAAPSLPAASAP